MKNKIFIASIICFFLLPPALLLVYAFSGSWPYPQIFPSSLSLQSFSYAVSQKKGILISLASSFAYTPALLPAMLFSMGAHYTFLKAGITDSFFGVVLILTTVSYPYMLRALTAGYMSCGEELTICARNLGSRTLQTFFTVEFPVLFPSVIAGASIVFLVSFSEYFLVFLIGGGIVPSYSGYLFPFLNSSEHSISSLLILIFFIIPAFLFAAMDYILKLYYRKRFMN
jgi:putative spermidine/putrescine transport system permease protein